MALTSTVAATITGAQGGHSDTLALPTITNSASPLGHVQVSLINGSVTIVPPSTALYVVIVPPNNSSVVKTFKGIAGDQGVPMSLTNWSVFAFPAPAPASFVITANNAEVVDIYFY